MKIKNTIEVAPPRFQPVTLAFTFETKEEFETIGRMFNSGPMCEVLRQYGVNQSIYEAFEDAGADISTGDFNDTAKRIFGRIG